MDGMPVEEAPSTKYPLEFGKPWAEVEPAKYPAIASLSYMDANGRWHSLTGCAQICLNKMTWHATLNVEFADPAESGEEAR
jgi:hypothetical protein